MSAAVQHIAPAISASDPAVARSRGGTNYRTEDEIWRIQDGVTHVSFNFRRVSLLVTPRLLGALKATLSWLLANKAATTVRNTFMSFDHMLRSTGRTASSPLAEITSADLIGYRASLSERQVNRLHSLAILLRKWSALDIGGVSKDAIDFLDALRMKSPVGGVPVRTMCPQAGPLTAIEDEAYQGALNTAYAEGRISDDEFFASWLTRALGQRPAQTAAMKICDLVALPATDGSVDFMIHVPRAKKRYLTHPRQALKLRPLLRQIAEPLQTYLQTVSARLHGHMPDPGEAPMFPRPKAQAGSAQGYEWHRTANEMAVLIAGASAKLTATSERTGQALHVSATRLRRTIGTRAAEEGHGELVVAEILDHSNSSSARYYVEATSTIVARIDSAMAHAMAPLARAFQGLQPASADAYEGALGEQILDLRVDQNGKALGQCHGTSCEFLAPISCYTCRAFRPWVDGPHQAVLDSLLARRDAQLASTAARVAVVNDRTILAVSEVIQLCQKLFEEQAHG